jgi:hypothetical protein
VPFLLVVAMIFFVDPFDYFNHFNFIDKELKKNTSSILNNCLAKMIEYKRGPSSNILLGDSRMDRIKAESLQKATGLKYYNFSFKGGTLPEIVTAFWFAAKNNNLKNVYIGINFNLYNSINNINRASEAESMIRNPLLYFCKSITLEACYYDLYAKITRRQPLSETPPMNKYTFWKYQLDVTTRNIYKRYEYPSNYYLQLKEIADYCFKNSINLVFIIHPTHVDLQQMVSVFKLSSQENRFKEDLKSLGAKVFDFDYPNEMTNNKENFEDPYHCKANCTEQIIKEVWCNDLKYAKVSR